jgi:hypothetical protein
MILEHILIVQFHSIKDLFKNLAKRYFILIDQTSTTDWSLFQDASSTACMCSLDCVIMILPSVFIISLFVIYTCNCKILLLFCIPLRSLCFFIPEFVSLHMSSLVLYLRALFAYLLGLHIVSVL